MNSYPLQEIQSPLYVDLKNFSGNAYLNRPPVAYNWILQNSLRCACLGVLSGRPGVGKSTFAIQMAVAVAAGMPLLGIWQTPLQGPTMYLSAEDDIDVIQTRINSAILRIDDKEKQELAKNNCYAVPLSGQLNLCRETSEKVVKPNQNFHALEDLIASERPVLVILDNLARFSGVEENNNASVTDFCTLLEGLCQKYSCSIILLHHSNKATGEIIGKVETLSTALSPYSARGASSLMACARWGLFMSPLRSYFAEQRLGSEAKGKPDGSFIACQVTKKNVGAQEPVHYLGRDENGLFSRLTEVQRNTALDDALLLEKEIRRREEAGETPLPKSSAGKEAFSWGVSRIKKAVHEGLTHGLFIEVKQGRGYYLASLVNESDEIAAQEIEERNRETVTQLVRLLA
jgi:hypothetical protein